MRAKRISESDDRYPSVCSWSVQTGKTTAHWRVIRCRDDLQWIVQRKMGVGSKQWRGHSYHTAPDSLISYCIGQGAIESALVDLGTPA